MTELSLAERLKIRSLSAERLRRRAVTRTLSSPLLRWRYGVGAADQILIVPQDLRSADPSFWTEIEHGHFGLAGEIADLRGASPFRITPPSPAWARKLHGFGWLRHLAAAEDDTATEAARSLVVEWIALHRIDAGIAFEPAVVGRRLLSWITNANLLLDGVDAKTYAAILGSIGRQIVALKTTWRNAPDGVPRMTALIAMVLADLAVSGHDRQLREAEAALVDEMRRQFLPDGGHVSRNASVLVDLILDVLPLAQCFQARGRAAPDEIGSAVKKGLAFLRFMRLGDGMLARFNGVSTGSPAALATVLGYCDGEIDAARRADNSGYARLECGQTVMLVDVGPPPPLAMATDAGAGALSFEITAGRFPILVNGGYPGPADRDWIAPARATASHNTLTLAEQSSSRIVRHPQLEALLDGPPIRGPDTVTASITEDGGAALLAASHDGYLKRFGLLHTRHLKLAGDGDALSGVDRLEPPRGALRLKTDLPYAVRFHLHPDCRLEAGHDPAACTIVLPNADRWTFSAEGINLSLEESIFYVDSAGPRPSMQIVLRGATYGEAEVRWHLYRAVDAVAAGDSDAVSPDEDET